MIYDIKKLWNVAYFYFSMYLTILTDKHKSEKNEIAHFNFNFNLAIR